MKRERTHRILHHFSFGERFDETMMNAYCVGNKYIAYTNHQFIGFLSTNKPAGKVAEVKITIRRPDGRMSDLQGKAHCIGAKKETADNLPTLPQAFKEQKSHSLLGLFPTHRPADAEKAPIGQRATLWKPLATVPAADRTHCGRKPDNRNHQPQNYY